MQVGDGKIFEQMQGVFKGRVGFAGKTGQDIDPDGAPGNAPVNGTDQIGEKFAGVRPAHAPQDRVIAALQGNVKVAAETGRCRRPGRRWPR